MKPLKVEIEGDELVIRVGLDTLKFAVEEDDKLQTYDLETGHFNGPVVSNISIFACEVVQTMNTESEDGTTPVHTFLDEMIRSAIDNGADGIEMPEDV